MRPWSRTKRHAQEPAPPEPRTGDRAPQEDDAALSPLEQRLSTMEWPKPPAGVRERLFEEIVERTERNGSTPGGDDGDVPDASSNGR